MEASYPGFGFVAGDKVGGKFSREGLRSTFVRKREAGRGPDFGGRWLY